MPRGKDAATLKKVCLGAITRNFDRIWAQVFDKHFGDIPRLLYVVGPFDNLPGQLCQDIVHALIQQRILRKTHLQLLLLPQLTHLDFSGASTTTVSAQALEILSVRCKSLASLNLTSCASLSPGAISQCISALPMLRTLILKRTKVSDSVLRSIASNLRNLTHLDLNACPVTDTGAIWLCGDDGDFDPVCSDLTILDISATKIGLNGCSNVIRTFPKLRYLSFADTIEAVALLHPEKGSRSAALNGVVQKRSSASMGETSSGGTGSTRQGITDIHQLQTLHATALKSKNVSPESVRIACAHCPNTREVYFYQNASDLALQHLSSLKQLAVLEVTSDQPGEVTFHQGFLPLLQSQGGGMISLGLYDMQDVDVSKIGVLCPYLQRLKLVSMYEDADFAHSYVPVQQLASAFACLRQLTVVLGPDDTRLRTEDLEHLLFNSHDLQEVHFINVQGITDNLLISALSRHGFTSLKCLQLESCNHITNNSLLQLVNSLNPLSQLTVRQCAMVSYADYQHLQREVTREHLELNIDWQ